MKHVHVGVSLLFSCTLACSGSGGSPQPTSPAPALAGSSDGGTVDNLPGASPDGDVSRSQSAPSPSPSPMPAQPSPTPAPVPPAVTCGNVIAAPATSGHIINVAAGGDLQAALNQAQPGDEIALQAGATFTGNFTLPNKSGAAYITVRTAAPEQLPPPGTRITPSYVLPKIVATGSMDAIGTAAGAHHWRFLGVEVTSAPGTYSYGVVTVGSGTSSNAADTPHDFIFDRVWIHGQEAGTQQGLALHGAGVTVANCRIDNIKSTAQDTQAIVGWNGPGPFTIVNNYLEAAGENLMFGGADPKIANLVPSDITIRYNEFAKPLSWKPGDPSYAGTHWVVKNLLELKNARRVTIDGNLFQYAWADGQSGETALFTVRNQDGTASWSTVESVRFTNNVARHVGGGVSITGHDNNYPSQAAHDFTVSNNLFYDVGGDTWGGWGRLATIDTGTSAPGPAGVTFDHNTCLQTGEIIAAATPSGYINHPGLVFTHNVVNHNASGVWGPGTAPGDATFAAYFTDAQFTGNVLIGGPAASYAAHPGNLFPASMDFAGTEDFHVGAAYAGDGVDYAPLDAAANCRISGS